MKAHDIRAALSDAPELTITSSTTGEEAEAAFPQLASFNEGGVFVGRYSGRPPWERHPQADELLHVLDGEVDVTVLTDDGPVHVTVRAGSIFVVPRGLWHRPVARAAATLLSATPKPTEVSFAEDPRRAG
jgi:quercetin dioxygenase-like cupin family protein